MAGEEQAASAASNSKGGFGFLGGLGYGVGSGLMSGIFGNRNSNSASKAAAQQYQYNLALQKQAQQWNEHMYKHRYQWQREDLENAGINALYGLGNAPSVTSGTNSVGMPDMVGEQNNKFSQMMSLLDFGQNLSAKRAQTKLIEQQALTEIQNTRLRSLEVIGKQLDNEFLPQVRRKELEEAQSRIIKNITETENNKMYNKLLETQQKASAREYELEQKWDEEHPIAKGWATAFRRFGIGIGASISGSASASRVHK